MTYVINRCGCGSIDLEYIFVGDAISGARCKKCGKEYPMP
jgi:hypothetical protein